MEKITLTKENVKEVIIKINEFLKKSNMTIAREAILEFQDDDLIVKSSEVMDVVDRYNGINRVVEHIEHSEYTSDSVFIELSCIRSQEVLSIEILFGSNIYIGSDILYTYHLKSYSVYLELVADIYVPRIFKKDSILALKVKQAIIDRKFTILDLEAMTKKDPYYIALFSLLDNKKKITLSKLEELCKCLNLEISVK